MSLISTFNIAPEDEEAFFKDLRWGNRFVNERIIVKRRPLSRGEKQAVAESSYLGEISLLWDQLSAGEKIAWSNAAVYSAQTGYNLFVQDTSARLKNNISGLAVPSQYHQANVGKITIPIGYGEYNIYQHHPDEYLVSRRIAGKQEAWENVLVAETMSFPMSYALNYKSAMTADGADPYIRFSVVLVYYVGAVLTSSEQYIDLSLSTDWEYLTDTIASWPYTIEYYFLFFRFKDVKGELWFDVPECVHDELNWTRDANCDYITWAVGVFSYFMPPAWGGSTWASLQLLSSVYPDD